MCNLDFILRLILWRKISTLGGDYMIPVFPGWISTALAGTSPPRPYDYMRELNFIPVK